MLIVVAACVRGGPADHSGVSETGTSSTVDSTADSAGVENWCGDGITPVDGTLAFDENLCSWTCQSSESLEQRCIDVFGGYTGGTCPRLRSILEATGWLAGSTTNAIAGATMASCTDPNGQPAYHFGWLDPPTPYSDTLYQHSLSFDASGVITSYLYQAIPYPGYTFVDGFCCEDEYVNHVWWGTWPDLTCAGGFLTPEDFADDTGLP